ncbi:hypothetical protein DENSPDRAFT_932059, partial [Dentipellis sp. KUC8613]
MSEDPFADIWTAAIKRYEADTKMSITDTSHGLAGVLTADQLLEAINDKQMKFKNYRSRGGKIRMVLKPVLAVIGLIVDAASEGVANAFPLGAAVFTAVRYLLGAARNVSSRYDSIIDLFSRLQNCLDRCRIYLEGVISADLKKRLVEILACILSSLGLVTKYIQKGRLKLFIQTLVSKEDNVSDALQRLDSLTKDESLVVQAETHQVAQHTLQEVGNAGKKVVEKLEKVQVNLELEGCFEWLSPPDPYINYNAAQEKLYNHTSGQWLLHDLQFSAWKQEKQSSLWLHGIPGSGKSVLCSTIVSTLLQEYKSKSSCAVAFFYFDFKDPSKQVFRGLLASLLGQLSSQNHNAFSVLKQLYVEHNYGHRQPSLLSLETALGNILKLFEAAYIILDALDECLEYERQRYLFPFMENLILDAEYPVHLFTISRNQIDIRACLETKVTHVMNMDKAYISKDIGLHLSTVFDKDRFFSNLCDDIKLKIRRVLLQRSNGMFLWIDCQLGELRKCKTTADIEEALHDMPQTLEATYERILQNIDARHSGKLCYMLRWIAFSVCPITEKELKTAFDIYFNNSTDVKKKSKFLNNSSLLEICSSLIVVYNGAIQFCHLSFQEYITSDNIKQGPLACYHVDAHTSHMIISEVCLASLSTLH